MTNNMIFDKQMHLYQEMQVVAGEISDSSETICLTQTTQLLLLQKQIYEY